jgi:NADH-quinone oxidoreductase subunit B
MTVSTPAPTSAAAFSGSIVPDSKPISETAPRLDRMRWLDWYGDGSLYVVDIALACCALEFEAAATGVAPAPAELARGTAVAVVVSGTVTDRLAPAVCAIIDACAERGVDRPAVISFGACASSGGPYWDSYSVTKGVDQLVPVDVFVPGCPPPPGALTEAIDALAGREPA